MNEKYLHIVSFNVPFPANYGGVIDVFYKLKALSENGVNIILHTFSYGREKTPELEKYCKEVHYYERKRGWKYQFSFLPYIVYTRKNKELFNNLLKDNHPILFEGIHTSYYIDHPSLSKRIKMLRAHNVEHLYYNGLAKNTSNFRDRLYFRIEAWKLRRYEKCLSYANHILALSTTELAYFKNHYGEEKVCYIPLFANIPKTLNLPDEVKPYVLYQGDLSTPENINAAVYLIQLVASRDQTIPWVFAGLNPPDILYHLANRYKNVSIRANLPEAEMKELIMQASVSLLYTNQVSGVKLKLLNALANGNHCLATREMVEGSGLESLCKIIPHNPDKIVEMIKSCFNETMAIADRIEREKLLLDIYDNDKNAQAIKYLF